jgi:hypothetical protein
VYIVAELLAGVVAALVYGAISRTAADRAADRLVPAAGTVDPDLADGGPIGSRVEVGQSNGQPAEETRSYR